MRNFPIASELRNFLRIVHECETITEELQESIKHVYVNELFFIEFVLDAYYRKFDFTRTGDYLVKQHN